MVIPFGIQNSSISCIVIEVDFLLVTCVCPCRLSTPSSGGERGVEVRALGKMNERFEKAAGLLPAALNVVLCKPEAVVDDTCLSRLLSWFETAFNCQDKAELLLSVIGDFVWKVCAEGKHPVAIAFGLKVSTVSDDVNALCWKSCLRWIADERLLEHSQAAVRCAAYDVLSNLTHIPDAVSLLGETGELKIHHPYHRDWCILGLHNTCM